MSGALAMRRGVMAKPITPPAAGYLAEVDADSPANHWRLGESSGTTAVDRIAAANGTYVNTPTLGAADPLVSDSDTAVTFTGGSSQSVTLPNFTVGTNATFEMWAKTSSGGSIFTLLHTSTATRVEVLINPRLVIELKNDAGTTGGTFEDGFVDDGVWRHIAVVKTGSGWELFVNGVTQATVTLAGTFTFNAAAIGRSPAVAVPNYFTGSVDEVAYYTTALTSVRLLAHRTAGIT